MKDRLSHLVYYGGWFIWAAAVAAPLIGLVWRLIDQGASPQAGWLLSARQAILLLKTIGLASAAATIACLLAMPAVSALSGDCGPRRQRTAVVIAAAVLLVSPMVTAFGWYRVLAHVRALADIPSAVRCVGTWALWGWPIPALLLAAGWARSGRSTFQMTLLDAGALRSHWVHFAYSLRRHLLASVLLLIAVFVNDYNVPQACLLQLYSTELLSWISTSPRLIDGVAPALPMIGCLALIGAGLLAIWRGMRSEAEDWQPSKPYGRMPGLWIVAGASLAIPLIGLLLKFRSPRDLSLAVETYGREMVQSVGLAMLAGIAATWMGIAAARSPWVMGVSLAAGFLPGPLVGQALQGTYLHVSAVSDGWAILVLAYVVRYGWIGVVAAYVARRSVSQDLIDQAKLERGRPSSLEFRLRYVMNWPVLLAGAAAVMAFSLTDLATVSMVSVPGIGLLSAILMEKFHRFEDQMLVSLTLIVLSATALAVGLLAYVVKRR